MWPKVMSGQNELHADTHVYVPDVSQNNPAPRLIQFC